VGSATTSTALPGWPNSYTGSPGDGYITNDTGHLWVWTGAIWTDVGQIVGPSGFSGFSGYSGSGISGYSGYSGVSGRSGYSGISGYSGVVDSLV
jgi:hypothetical protein